MGQLRYYKEAELSTKGSGRWSRPKDVSCRGQKRPKNRHEVSLCHLGKLPVQAKDFRNFCDATARAMNRGSSVQQE